MPREPTYLIHPIRIDSAFHLLLITSKSVNSISVTTAPTIPLLPLPSMSFKAPYYPVSPSSHVPTNMKAVPFLVCHSYKFPFSTFENSITELSKWSATYS